MNPAFWLIVVVILIVLYFCGAFIFPYIGGIAVRVYNDFKAITSVKAEEGQLVQKEKGKTNNGKQNKIDEG